MVGTTHTPVMDGSICPQEKSSCTSPPGTRAQASVAGDVADCWHPLVFFGASSTDFLAEASAWIGEETGMQICAAPACGRKDSGTFFLSVAVSVMQFTWDFYVIPIPTHDAVFSVMQQLILSGLYGNRQTSYLLPITAYTMETMQERKQ